MALTAGEIEILLKAKDEATAAINRVGEAVKKLGPEAENASKSAGLLDASFAKLTASFSVAGLIERGVSSIVGFGLAAVNSASEIVDLSSKTGLTIAEIQRMGFVATQTGSSMDAFTTAAYKLGVAIESGSPGVRQAIADLGLEFNKIRNMTPTDQFNEVLRSLHMIEDETRRNLIAQELFSKTFAGIAAAVEQGYDNMKQGAVVATDAQIKAASDAQNAWNGFWQNVKSSFSGVIGELILASQAHQKAAFESFSQSQASAEGYRVSLDGLSEAQQAQLKAAMESIGAEVKLNAKIDEGSVTRAKYTEILAAQKSELVALKPATEAEFAAAVELGVATERLAKEFSLTTSQVDILKKSLQEKKKASDELYKAVSELDSAGRSWRGTLSGIDAQFVVAIKRYLEAGVSQGALATAYGLTATQVGAVAKALEVEKKVTLEVGKLWAEYEQTRTEAGGTATEKTVADVKRWAAELTLRMKQAGADTHLFYDALAATSRAKIDSAMVDWDRLATVSKKHLEDIAAREKATFEEMKRDSGNYSAEAIEHQRQVKDAAIAAARNWRDAQFQAQDEVAAKSEETAKKMIDAFMKAETLNQRASQSFTSDLPPLTQQELKNIANSNPLGPQGEDAIWAKLQELEAREGTKKPRNNEEFFELQREALLLARLRMWAQGKTRPDKFKNAFGSGVENFKGGTALIGEEGPELVRLPIGSSVVPNGDFGGGAVFHKDSIKIEINWPVMTDRAGMQKVADVMLAALGGKLKSLGVRLPNGA